LEHLLDLDLSPLWSPVGLLLFGLCLGSFINVVVHRMPLMMARRWWGDTAWQLEGGEGLDALLPGHGEPDDLKLQRQKLALDLHERLQALPALDLNHPRSHCPACGHVLRWTENIPVLSWLFLRARCSACGVPISLRYPLVELAAGLLFVAAGLRWGFEPIALLWGAWASMLLAMSLIDWDTTLLPDSMTLPLLWGGLLAALMGWTLPVTQALWGAMLGYGGLWAVVWLFERVTGKQAMGGGDLKLLAALGAWLGPAALLPVVFMASLFGAVVGLAMKSRGALREGRFVPFGPFLAGAGYGVACLGAERLLAGVGL
jgi:leader peptidase (prepilin peptidase)/N-methyltransferase